MKVKDICTLEAITTLKQSSALQAAQLMDKNNVGSLVVVEETTFGKIPIGIITDRDITLCTCTKDVRPSSISVESIMSEFPLSAKAEDTVYNVLEKMRSKTIRRVPVTDQEGMLIGILSIDDILAFLVEEMNDIIDIFNKEQETLWL